MDDCCGDESEEKNPYPANDYIGINNKQKGLVNNYTNPCVLKPSIIFHCHTLIRR